MAKITDVLKEIVALVGQDQVYTECGGDFEICDCATSRDCPDYSDCVRQSERAKRTAKILKMMEEI